MGCNPPGRNWSSVVPHEFLCPPANLPLTGILFHGDMGLSWTVSAQASHKVTASFGLPPALVWIPAPQGPPWAVVAQLLHHCLTQKLQGNLCSWGRASLSLCSNLDVWRAVTLMCCCSSVAVVQIYLLLCDSVAPETLPLSLMVLGWASGVSVRDPPGTGKASHSFSQKSPL